MKLKVIVVGYLNCQFFNSGAYCSTSLVDKLGRRFLISLSALGISSGMLVFAIYSYLNDQGHVPSYLNWIPLVSFSFVMFIANFGVLTLPFLVMSELMITLPHVSTFIDLEIPPRHLSFFITDKKLHLHIVSQPLVDICLCDYEVLRLIDWIAWNRRFDVDLLNQLFDRRSICNVLRAGNERKKFSGNPRNFTKIKKVFSSIRQCSKSTSRCFLYFKTPRSVTLFLWRSIFLSIA